MDRYYAFNCMQAFFSFRRSKEKPPENDKTNMKRKAILKDLASDERSSASRKSSRQRRDSLKLIRLKQAQNKVSIE